MLLYCCYSIYIYVCNTRIYVHVHTYIYVIKMNIINIIILLIFIFNILYLKLFHECHKKLQIINNNCECINDVSFDDVTYSVNEETFNDLFNILIY